MAFDFWSQWFMESSNIYWKMSFCWDPKQMTEEYCNITSLKLVKVFLVIVFSNAKEVLFRTSLWIVNAFRYCETLNILKQVVHHKAKKKKKGIIMSSWQQHNTRSTELKRGSSNIVRMLYHILYIILAWLLYIVSFGLRVFVK